MSTFQINNSYQMAFPVYNIPLSDIRPRKVNAYAISDISALAASIERSGLLQPAIVRKNNDGAFDIVAGERRYTAFCALRDKFAGDPENAAKWAFMPCILLPQGADEETVYRDTNDYSRQLNNFQRIARIDPDRINMRDSYWQEQYVRYVYGEDKIPKLYTGEISVKNNRRTKAKLIRFMALESEPDLDLAESTVRNYLAFWERCSPPLRTAAMRGDVSVREAQALSWLSDAEQALAVESTGADIFRDYVTEGRSIAKAALRPSAPDPASTYAAELKALAAKYADALGADHPTALQNALRDITALIRKL